MTNLLSGITRDMVAQAAGNFGFRHQHVVEQLFVDFAACSCMTERLPCTIFGGMCMHLHSEGVTQRLSRDVDIMTAATAGDVDRSVHEVFGSMQDCQIESPSPQHPHPIKNLRSYYINYESRMGGRKSVKIDFLCDFASVLQTEEVHVRRVLGVDRPFKARVLTVEALLADKMTTLALGGIGLPEWRLNDAPKQVYDIAALARMMGETGLSIALDTLHHAIASRIALQANGADITVRDTVTAIRRSVEGFVNFRSSAIMSNQYKSHLENFRTTYLQNGGDGYQKLERINDLFAVLLLSTVTEKVTDGATDTTKPAEGVASALAEADRVSQVTDSAAQSAKRRSLLGMLSHKDVTKGFLSGLSLGHPDLLEAAYAGKPDMLG